MEKKFGIPLRQNLDVWPDFIEICERRNLLTHTGGTISHQYLKNCTDHGVRTEGKIGDVLTVDLAYLERAIEAVAEIGAKLCHTLWRKFNKQDREKADSALNALGMDLIKIKRYDTAERILGFGVGQKNHASDMIRRMMVVNFANALKLNGNISASNQLLDQHDWTATSPQFRICVASVRNDIKGVCDLISLGERTLEISASDVRDWPVFRDIRRNSDFVNAFESAYGEPLFPARRTLDTSTAEEAGPEHDDTRSVSTIH